MSLDETNNSPAPPARWDHQRVLVIGLGASGVAATDLLLRRGAKVTAVDHADNPGLQQQAEELGSRGAQVLLGVKDPPAADFDLAVLSPGVPVDNPLVQAVQKRGTPLMGELELGFQCSLCPNIAITGTNGKTTTTELVEKILTQAQRKTLAAGNIGLPVCQVADRTAEMDFLTLEVSSFQLESIHHFRPLIAVLLNITPDHLDRYASLEDYARAKARLFMNQQVCDWALVQKEAFAQLQKLGMTFRANTITFSVNDSTADIYLDQGTVVSRLPGAQGTVLDMAQIHLQGPHNAENVMAAWAVARVLQLPQADIIAAVRDYHPARHRCEVVAEVHGVRFVNDSKATNVDAVHKALLTMPRLPGDAPNVWLIAGGKDKGFGYQELGPVLARRVKRAFLMGETRQKIHDAWSLFTPCTLVDSLLEAVTEAARQAQPGEVVLLSPACSSFDMFQNYQHRGEVFRHAVQAWAASQSAVAANGKPAVN